MLVCIPTNDDSGLDAALCDHFGSAPFFMLYETDDDRLTAIANANAHHGHGTCHPMGILAAHRINAVVCRGMGRRAIEMLNADGVRVLRSRSRTVRETVSEIKQGLLAEMTPHEACAGHGGRQIRADTEEPTGHSGCAARGNGTMNGFGRGRGGSHQQ